MSKVYWNIGQLGLECIAIQLANLYCEVQWQGTGLPVSQDRQLCRDTALSAAGARVGALGEQGARGRQQQARGVRKQEQAGELPGATGAREEELARGSARGARAAGAWAAGTRARGARDRGAGLTAWALGARPRRAG